MLHIIFQSSSSAIAIIAELLAILYLTLKLYVILWPRGADTPLGRRIQGPR
jgi:hypothetical protein